MDNLIGDKSKSGDCSPAGKVSRGDEGDGFGMGFRFPWQKKDK